MSSGGGGSVELATAVVVTGSCGAVVVAVVVPGAAGAGVVGRSAFWAAAAAAATFARAAACCLSSAICAASRARAAAASARCCAASRAWIWPICEWIDESRRRRCASIVPMLARSPSSWARVARRVRSASCSRCFAAASLFFARTASAATRWADDATSRVYWSALITSESWELPASNWIRSGFSPS